MQPALQQARRLSRLWGMLIAQGVRPYFLDVQFRSHPKLAEFSSEMISQTLTLTWP